MLSILGPYGIFATCSRAGQAAADGIARHTNYQRQNMSAGGAVAKSQGILLIAKSLKQNANQIQNT